jgi:DNA mismatch endonuclease (patch repair protein)
MMSGIRGRDKKPEIIVPKYLHARGLRYRIAPKNLPGKPDIVLPKYRTVVFVHGCFWHRHHGCRYAATPASNRDFWQAKFKQNLARDTLVRTQLEKHGWKVLIVWECEVSLGRLQLLVDEIQSKRKS